MSAATGVGMEELFAAIDGAAEEYYDDYLPDLQSRVAAAIAKDEAEKADSLERLAKDMKGVSVDDSGARSGTAALDAAVGVDRVPAPTTVRVGLREAAEFRDQVRSSLDTDLVVTGDAEMPTD